MSSDSSPQAAASGDRGAITVVLADDHQVVRSGLRVLLASDGRFDVVGEAGDVAGTLATVRASRPRVLVLDLNMGGESSLDTIPQLRADAPETQIVVLTMQENPAFAQAALRAGAVGYVLKDAADSELMTAVVSAAEGRTYLNPELGARLAAQPADSDGRPDNLSPREVEVLKLIALGHTNGEIASSLFLSVRTVESHRAHIQQKVGLTTRAELVSYARDRGLLG
ncbi:MAG TPA: response regulator transcription factor [Solirubrobacteraceae bacterium]|nr:response regulator transcription factor [Solirubrobacteraceae bacterium]